MTPKPRISVEPPTAVEIIVRSSCSSVTPFHKYFTHSLSSQELRTVFDGPIKKKEKTVKGEKRVLQSLVPTPSQKMTSRSQWKSSHPSESNSGVLLRSFFFSCFSSFSFFSLFSFFSFLPFFPLLFPLASFFFFFFSAHSCSPYSPPRCPSPHLPPHRGYRQRPRYQETVPHGAGIADCREARHSCSLRSPGGPPSDLQASRPRGCRTCLFSTRQRLLRTSRPRFLAGRGFGSMRSATCDVRVHHCQSSPVMFKSQQLRNGFLTTFSLEDSPFDYFGIFSVNAFSKAELNLRFSPLLCKTAWTSMFMKITRPSSRPITKVLP